MDLPYIYRFNSPPGCKGRRCRRLTFDPPVRDSDGRVIIATGDQYVVVEFDNGRRESVLRSAIVAAASRPGRQTIARVARGDTKMVYR